MPTHYYQGQENAHPCSLRNTKDSPLIKMLLSVNIIVELLPI